MAPEEVEDEQRQAEARLLEREERLLLHRACYKLEVIANGASAGTREFQVR